MKEVNLKRLHTVRFQLHNILKKAKLWRNLQDQWFPGAGGGEDGQRDPGGFLGRWTTTTLYDTPVADTCHHVLVKTWRMYSAQRES